MALFNATSLFVFVSLFLVALPSQAQDASRLYSQEELQNIGSIYTPNLRGMWKDDFLQRLRPAERRMLSAVALDLPLIGATRSPLEFYSHPAERRVVIPIGSVKFLDDLSVAFAYYDKMGCDLGAVSDYAAALRFQSAPPAGSPLASLGVPRVAVKDRYVDDVSMKILKSNVFFLMAHEYAHVMYRHKGYSELTAPQAQEQEAQADRFALDVMRRIGIPPIGLAFFFLVASRLERTPGDFASAAEYESYLQQQATHPVSALRLQNVADLIAQKTEDFARLEPDPAAAARRLLQLTPQLREIGSTLDDRRMRLFLAERARAVSAASLQSACRK